MKKTIFILCCICSILACSKTDTQFTGEKQTFVLTLNQDLDIITEQYGAIKKNGANSSDFIASKEFHVFPKNDGIVDAVAIKRIGNTKGNSNNFNAPFTCELENGHYTVIMVAIIKKEGFDDAPPADPTMDYAVDVTNQSVGRISEYDVFAVAKEIHIDNSPLELNEQLKRITSQISIESNNAFPTNAQGFTFINYAAEAYHFKTDKGTGSREYHESYQCANFDNKQPNYKWHAFVPANSIFSISMKMTNWDGAVIQTINKGNIECPTSKKVTVTGNFWGTNNTENQTESQFFIKTTDLDWSDGETYTID